MKWLRFLLPLLLPLPLWAQTGAVTGVALDSVGNTVAGATITVCPNGSSGIPCSPVTASTTSNGQGTFSVTVPIGTYTVTVFRSGVVATSSTIVVAPSNITVANNVTYAGTVTYTGSITFTNATGTFNALNGCQYVNANQTFAQALAAVSTPGCIQITPGTYAVSANATIPAGVALVNHSCGVLSIATGVMLTINGGIDAIVCQLFSYTGTGVVKFGFSTSVRLLYPEWFGAKRDGVTDDRVALQNTWNASLPPSGSAQLIPIYLTGGFSYLVGSPGLNFTGVNQYLIYSNGNQGAATIQINFTGANTVGMDISAGINGTMRGFTITCGTSTANAPTVCLLHARTAASNAIECVFEKMLVDGYSPWIYYNYRGEAAHWTDSTIAEFATTGTPVTLSLVNTAGITSPNVTFGGVASMDSVTFDGGAMTVGSNSTVAGGKDIYFDEGTGGAFQFTTFRGFVNQTGTNQTVVGDTTGATGTIFSTILELTTNSTSPSTNTVVNMAGNVASWRIDGMNGTASQTTTPFVFQKFQDSSLRFITSVTSGSCFTSTSAIGSTIQLDPSGCATATQVTAPHAASVSTVSDTSYPGLGPFGDPTSGSVNLPIASNGGVSVLTTDVPGATGILIRTAHGAGGGFVNIDLDKLQVKQLGGTGASQIFYSTTAPTIAAAGCGGAAASVTSNNGTIAFEVNVGTTPGSACTITMPAAAHKWICTATDFTTNSTSVFLQKQSPVASQTTTQVVITNFSDVAVATAFVASDVMGVSCHAY